MLDVSVVIPAYNEEQRLPATLESVCGFLSRSGKAFEVIVVDDGSKDGTAGVVQDLAKRWKQIRLISYAANHGKGYAVRTGVAGSTAGCILLDDSDGSSPIAELPRLEDAIECGADIAIGSRAKPSGGNVVRAQAHRKYIGNTFNKLVQALLLPGIMDTQCGFKLYRAQAAKKIFSRSRLDGYGFDVETLYVAKRLGYKIAEVPINWNHVQGSKVNVLIDSPRMLMEVLGIAVAARAGAYKKDEDV